MFDKLKRISPPIKERLGSRAADPQRTGQRTLPMLSAKICTIPNPFTTDKDTADHAIGAIYQLMAVEYIAVLILHTGFSIMVGQLLRVK